jgi:hypothetical protein
MQISNTEFHQNLFGSFRDKTCSWTHITSLLCIVSSTLCKEIIKILLLVGIKLQLSNQEPVTLLTQLAHLMLCNTTGKLLLNK